MKAILANYSVSITELKKSPSEVIKKAGDEAVAILNHNTPSAYIVPSAIYEKMMDILNDYMLSKKVESRLREEFTPIKVNLDDL